MTQAETIRKMHGDIVEIKTILIGNGIKGVAKQVEENTKYINTTKEDHIKVVKHDKLYYKLIGIGITLSVIFSAATYFFH